MHNSIHVSVIACSLLTASYCEAGGIFRRIPEIGDWARFEYTLKGEPIAEKDEAWPVVPDASGEVTVKCVGEEFIDEARHLWIECHRTVIWNGGEAAWIFKALVPEAGLMTSRFPSL